MFHIIIRFNDNNKKSTMVETFEYKYNNKHIVLKMFKESFAAEYYINGKNNNINNFTNLFFDLIKKINLIYAIYYSEIFYIQDIVFYLDNKKVYRFKYNQNDKIVNCLVKDFCYDITQGLKNRSTINKIICCTKSNYTFRHASLFAYIIAKSKTIESERLQFYWISMNGFYNKYKNSLENATEIKLINCLLSEYKCKPNNSEEITKKERNTSVPEVANVLRELVKGRKNNEKVSKKDIDSIGNKINKVLKKHNLDKKIKPYGYVLTQIPYEYRCNMFHANKPIDIFFTIKERDNLVLKIINDIMEEFLDNHIAELFNK